MTFSNTVTVTLPLGTYDPKWISKGKRYYLAWGTFTEDAMGTTGELATGLSGLEWLICVPNGAAAAADQVTTNETFPLASGTATIIFTAGTDGYWIALGWK
jgi:hypothetical protein